MMRLLPLSFLPSSQVSIEYFLAEFPSFCARCCPLDIVTGPLPLLLNEQLSLQRVSGLMHGNRLMSVSWITRQENNVDRSFKIHLQLPLNSFQKQLSTEIFQSHTWYLSRAPRVYPCKFFLAGVNFYRFNAKNWHFWQILREKVAFFTDLTRKIGVFRCKFYSPKILPV